MRITLLTLPVLSTILACGPEAPGDSETEPGTTGTGTAGTTDSGTASSDSVSATEPPATTDALPTTGPETSTSGPVETTTSGPVETSTSGPIETTSGPVETTTSTTVDPSTTTTGETDGAPGFEFAVQFWAGGLDHLTLRMAALKDDYCVEIQFARPGGSELPGLTLPTDWWYQGATVSPGVVDCLDFMASLPPGAFADSIAGSAAWTTDSFCPSTLDAFELLLEFPQDEPWVPADVQVFGGPVAVSGC
ncbi:hypothetical protein [Nannocystis bainbridge]|uniref:Uncharacterized protein n=1 Tax=Nannocystis bainbridge TaxID=2995303 RepID=A0ABT5DXA0_9BACT|nr:hypothetical protein [Nannocystis bainbridge]MDC0717062.1 hypothetical protein [Nannocystis bainbridge]